MRAVLDTNVLVAGLLQPYGPPGEIVRMLSFGTLQLFHDSRILSEYREVLLRPKFSFKSADVEALVEEIRIAGQPVAASPLGFSLSDADDELFLEVALAAGSRWLITGDLKGYMGYRGRETKIISPAKFLEEAQG